MDYEKNETLFSVDLNYFAKSLAFDLKEEISSQGGHYGYWIQKDRFSKAQVNYSYLGLKLSVGHIFLKKQKFNLIVGPFAQLERLVYEKESNHSSYTVESGTSVGFDHENDEIIHTDWTKVLPISYEPFDLLELSPNYLSIGLQIVPRIQIKSIVIVPFYNIGVNIKPRTNNTRQDEKHSTHFHELGFKIGYRFP